MNCIRWSSWHLHIKKQTWSNFERYLVGILQQQNIFLNNICYQSVVRDLTSSWLLKLNVSFPSFRSYYFAYCCYMWMFLSCYGAAYTRSISYWKLTKWKSSINQWIKSIMHVYYNSIHTQHRNQWLSKKNSIWGNFGGSRMGTQILLYM